jgi:electron transfer flavoprotein beta subunit
LLEAKQGAMNILVCMKQILDPEIPARDFRIDRDRREAERGSAALVTNIFCENALETALQFREAHGGKITAITCGSETGEEVLRKALALRADEAVLIASPAANPDPLFVAKTLAGAIKKIGSVDIVLVGREAGDWGAGQTGGLLAEELGAPCIAFAESFEPAAEPGKVRVKRQTDNGWELLESTTPLVVTITNHEHNVPRIPKTRDVMQSYKKPLTKWNVSDLGIDPLTSNTYYKVADLFVPQKETRCEFIAGDSLETKIDAFAKRVSEVVNSI